MAKMRGWVVAVGNAFDGLHLFGLFNSQEEATAWGEQKYPMHEWNVVKVAKPGKYKRPVTVKKEEDSDE